MSLRNLKNLLTALLLTGIPWHLNYDKDQLFSNFNHFKQVSLILNSFFLEAYFLVSHICIVSSKCQFLKSVFFNVNMSLPISQNPDTEWFNIPPHIMTDVLIAGPLFTYYSSTRDLLFQ